MAEDTKNKPPNTSEIQSLNLDDLDVEELERRVELATMVPGTECYINCGCDGTDCSCNGKVCDCYGHNPCDPNICVGNCPSLCGANCGTNCIADCGCNCQADIARLPTPC